MRKKKEEIYEIVDGIFAVIMYTDYAYFERYFTSELNSNAPTHLGCHSLDNEFHIQLYSIIRSNFLRAVFFNFSVFKRLIHLQSIQKYTCT